MIRPGTLNLSGDRWTPFEATLRFRGVDLTAAGMKAQVRLTPDTPGPPLVDLETVSTTNTQGVRLVGVETVDGVKTSTFRLRVNEAVMEALPAATELGGDSILAWDLLITPNAALNPGLRAIKQRWLRGTFTVEAGVTQ